MENRFEPKDNCITLEIMCKGKPVCMHLCILNIFESYFHYYLTMQSALNLKFTVFKAPLMTGRHIFEGAQRVSVVELECLFKSSGLSSFILVIQLSPRVKN